MKKILIAAAALVAFTALNTGSAKAWESIDPERFIAAMGDSYNGYTYRNIYKLEGFIAALEESYEGHGRPSEQERFIAAMGDAYVPVNGNAGYEKAAALIKEKHAEEAFTAGYAPRRTVERDLFTGSFLVIN